MAQRTNTQIDLIDAMIARTPNLNAHLDQIDSLIDWAPFKVALQDIYSSTFGPKSYSPLLLFKALLLQVWYDLSDYGLIVLIGFQ